jgi:hypothetical protein
VSDVAIRAAIEMRLAAMVPPLDTAWENAAYSPVTNKPYQRVSMMRARPENPTYDTFKRKLGVMQITLFYPQANGPSAAETRADSIGAWFPRGLTLQSGGITVLIDGTAYVMAGFQDGDRWAVPVRVPYFANIP